MKPSFFGASGRQLFGAYHAPTGASSRSLGLVLCNPGPQEYRQCHYVLRRLAVALAADGFHVLRFDYFATGDSAGESRAGTLEQWTSDIGTAVAELKDLSGVRRVALVGIRLGATLAALAASKGVSVAQLVLWDPIVSGAKYLAQLGAQQERVLATVHFPEEERREADELLGYAMPPSMRQALHELDLLRVSPPRASQTLIICAEARQEYDALHERIAGAGIDSALRHEPDATLYDAGPIRDTLLAHRIPAVIHEHLTGRGR